MRGVFSGFMRRTSWFGTPSRLATPKKKTLLPTTLTHAGNQPREQTKTPIVSLCEILMNAKQQQDRPENPRYKRTAPPPLCSSRFS